ncbi:regulatory protein RecX [Martelella alba]|uniref:Regulatory protein RecX n=2 Tax=Martelella alba TaxID=2590451 RepID=A0ABY2SRU2_9HYPH|nr:regulatory protein RecX [Martelella alba]
MRILSRRDHSEAELRSKLKAVMARDRLKSSLPPQEPERRARVELDEVIDYCRRRDWLNDSRFTASYVTSRSNKGYGEQKIRAELKQKGVKREIIDAAFAEAAIDRPAQAMSVAQKKFGQPLPAGRLEKIKVQRYLLARGFSFEEIQAIYTNSIR